MRRQPAKRSSLFLLELIIAILFFCLASAVCVRFFVKSHTLSQDTKNLNMAVTQAASAADILRGQKDAMACLKAQYPEGLMQENDSGFNYTVFYDADWKLCAQDAAAYRTEVALSRDASFETGTVMVTMLSSGSTLYSLDVKNYIPKEAAADES